jgi:hypothetical protein
MTLRLPEITSGQVVSAEAVLAHHRAMAEPVRAARASRATGD